MALLIKITKMLMTDLPMPVLAPVTTASRPSSLAEDWQLGPWIQELTISHRAETSTIRKSVASTLPVQHQSRRRVTDTAMTPTTLRNRKRYLMRQKRKTERRRWIAQSACTSTSNDSPASSNSDSMDTSDDEMSEDEQSVSNLGDSADSISKKYIYRRMKCLMVCE